MHIHPERLRINVALYRRFLGHEGHHFELGNGIGWLWCTSCNCEVADLTTDGNAMLALGNALEANGWNWSYLSHIREASIWRDDPACEVVSEGDAPEALALAAYRLPEDDHEQDQ